MKLIARNAVRLPGATQGLQDSAYLRDVFYSRVTTNIFCIEIEFDDDAKPHIDVWLGSSTVNGGSIQIACEDKLSPKLLQTIVRHPGQILKVDCM